MEHIPAPGERPVKGHAMNDRQLQELLRMAAEVEAIEAHASSTLGQVSAWTNARRPTVLRRAAWAGLSIAAAVALGAGFFVILRPVPVVPADNSAALATFERPESQPLAVNPVEDAIASPTITLAAAPVFEGTSAPATPGILLAIYQDILGASRCVQVLPLAMNPGQTLADVSRIDLLHADDLSGGSSCATGPHRLLIVAIAGPSGSLPSSDASAEALASCIADSRDVCSEALSSYANAAAACLPPGVSVRVESTFVLR